MKKQLLFTTLIFSSIYLSAQEWKKNNNETGLWARDKFGGTNTRVGIGTNNPNYRFEVFGTSKLHSNVSIDSTLNVGPIKLLGLSGEIHNALWSGINKRLMIANEDGFLVPMPMGNANQVLFGNGTWGNLPVSNNVWHQNGNTVFYDQGYVGIGTQYPVFQLDVLGDARISNNLYVGGGIVISDKMRANIDIKTRLMDADSIKMGVDKVIYGETKIDGDVKLKYQLDVVGNANFHGNQYLDGSQFLQGSQDVNGTLIARQGLTFDGTNGFRRTVNASGNSVYKLGGPISTDPVNPCEFPNQSEWFCFGGKIQLYDSPSNTSLTMGSDGFQSIIESEGNNKLLLNWYCGKDVSLCTGANATSSNGRGGVVRMGHNVMIGGPWPADNYDIALNVNGVEQTGLFVKSVSTTNPYNYGVVSSVNGLNNKAFAVLLQNGNNDKEIISLRGNGEAFFGALTSTVKPTLYVSPSINTNNQLGTGRVGIGTETPATALDVKGDVTVSNLGDGANTRTLLVDANGKLVAGTTSSTTAIAWNLGGNSTNTIAEYFGTTGTTDLILGTAGTPKMTIGANGNLGVGTTNPQGIFEIMDQLGSSLIFKGNGWGDIQSSTSIRPHFSNGKDFTIFEGEVGNGQYRMILSNKKVAFNDANPDRNIKVVGLVGEKVEMQLHSQTASESSIYWATNESLSYGFGTVKNLDNSIIGGIFTDINSTSPNRIMGFVKGSNGSQVWIGDQKGSGSHIDARLSVDGKLVAKSIYVTITGGQWADYVFSPNYKLPKLADIETYYKKHQHLPEIPSVEEVEKNGVEIGQINTLLLKKIEELTIYLVEQEKLINSMNERLKSMENSKK